MSEHEQTLYASLDAALRVVPADAVGEISALGLMRESMERQHAELDEEFRPALDAVLTGSKVRGETVDVKLLVDALGPLQEAVTAAGQALTDRATDRAPVPGHIRDATALRVVATFPGSFGVRLEGPDDAQPPSLFSDLDRETSTFEQAVGAIMELFVAAEDDASVPTMREALARVGRRCASHLKALSATFAGGDDRLKLSWRDRGDDQTTTFDHESAHRIEVVLDTTDIGERTARMAGKLVGASVSRHTFELEAQGESIIRGAVAPSVSPMLRVFFDADCVATLEISTSTSTVDGTVSEAYLLTGLED